MTKQADPKAFQRSVIIGFRYSRGPTDSTPPTPPVLSPSVSGVTTIDIHWTNGIDPETGIASTYCEISPSGTGNWVRSVVLYPGSSFEFTGLTSLSAYDIRIANVDPVGNVSTYSPVQTLTTLPSSAQLEPGTIDLPIALISGLEGTPISVPIRRVGAGSASPIVQADWAYTGFTTGLPSPANGTVQWASGENDSQLALAVAGPVNGDQSGFFNIVAVRALSGNISPTLGSNNRIPATIKESSNVAGVKWHPGHYMLPFLGDGPTYANRVAEVVSETSLKGLKARFFWAALEGAQGDYSSGFSIIDTLRNSLNASGKKLIITIEDRRFGSANPNSIVPTYIQNMGGGNNGVAATSNGGFIACIWRTAIMDRLIALHQALAARYDGDIAIEAICGEETAPSFNSVTPPADYSVAALTSQLIRLNTASKKAWLHTSVIQEVNFLGGQSNVTSLENQLAALGVAFGGPDILPNAPVDGQLAYIGSAAGSIDQRGIVPCMHDVQSPELGGNLGNYLPIDLFTYANATLHATHMFWVRNTLSANAAQNWGNGTVSGILWVIRNNPLTHISCPSAYGSCNVS